MDSKYNTVLDLMSKLNHQFYFSYMEADDKEALIPLLVPEIENMETLLNNKERIHFETVCLNRVDFDLNQEKRKWFKDKNKIIRLERDLSMYKDRIKVLANESKAIEKRVTAIVNSVEERDVTTVETKSELEQLREEIAKLSAKIDELNK